MSHHKQWNRLNYETTVDAPHKVRTEKVQLCLLLSCIVCSVAYLKEFPGKAEPYYVNNSS
jgi:hypothetical protein